jgi:hypothetical protein
MSKDDKNGMAGGGHAKPPRSGQFRKGASGNPRGRPKGSHRKAPYDELLSQIVEICDQRKMRKVPLYEALQLSFFKLATSGNNAATRAIEDLRVVRGAQKKSDALTERETVIHFVTPGSVNMALEPLGMGRILDRIREATARVALEPWLVQAALKRLGDNELTPEEQKTVLKATRTPKKVNWPDWWAELPE